MKRLIVCLDGTWNDNDAPKRLTNVAKLHQAIAAADRNGVQQISHYIEGIASTKGERFQFLRGALGHGVAERIRKTYELISATYEPGDEIYLFGFSRGAFEARSLIGLIALVGIARHEAAFSFDDAWSAYRARNSKHGPAMLAGLRAAAHYPARIKCAGVWDTVGNIGNPLISGGIMSRRQRFHDTAWKDIIGTGLHALSIDEQRGSFSPMLWTLPEGQSLPADQHIEQVWFAGTHADVGGGWRETGLSDISLLWMAERAGATCGLAFDHQKLAAQTRPDPLAPQHASATGKLFLWSRLIPFVRLVKQGIEAVAPFRLNTLGTWRTGKLPRGQAAINESVHESAAQRFGQMVIELVHGRSRMITYRPRALAPLVPEPQAQTHPATGKPRRVKVFTVHGTFAHETAWDDWDTKDDLARPAEARHFINRLSEKLRAEGITLDAADHAQYNWSGGNSHDERRNAAIGLKKHIQNVLAEDEKLHGKNYYDSVYVVSHSHGGTISRMAMNLWDKPHDYYDPVKSDTVDELKHDDTCQVCMRARNGIVGPGTIPRPDGVITFGSPFVTFEKRKAGLVTARLGAWVFRAFALVIAAGLLGAAYNFGVQVTAPDLLLTPVRLGWPLIITWLLASYLPSTMLPRLERWFGKGNLFFAVNAVLQVIKYAVLAVFAVYIAAYIYGKWTGIGGWEQAKLWLSFITNPTLQVWLAWLTLIGVSWALVITLPGRFLRWLKRTVKPLGNKLPTKYDPSEDQAVKYLSYHTPGDEAGLGLRFFGSLTWIIQTFGLAAACMLALGVLLIPYIAIEAILHLLTGKGLLSSIGISAFSSDELQRGRFIVLMDWLTALPRTVLPQLGLIGPERLSELPNAHAAAWWMPLSIMITLFTVFLLLMPVMFVLLGIAYLVALWLRRSGMVFGGESMAWNLSNRIAVSRRPNANTAMRVMLLSPEAWWRKEIAHCYYYRSERVISDLAQSIANWRTLETAPALPIGRWLSAGARGLIVAVAMLSIFALAAPLSAQLAVAGATVSQTLYGLTGGDFGSPGSSDPNAPPKLVEDGAKLCWDSGHSVEVPKIQKGNEPGWENTDWDAMQVTARPLWEAEVGKKFGADWANWVFSSGSCGDQTCYVKSTVCKLRPIECKDTPHAVEADFVISPNVSSTIKTDTYLSIRADLKDIWKREVEKEFGPEWTATANDDFKTLRSFNRPIEEGCKEESLDGGRIRQQCKFAVAPCKAPLPLAPESVPNPPAVQPPAAAPAQPEPAQPEQPGRR